MRRILGPALVILVAGCAKKALAPTVQTAMVTRRDVIVDAPGTLRGAALQLGADRVVLDGSGEAVISQSPGARIRKRELLATPGAHGFDTPALSFQIHPIA